MAAEKNPQKALAAIKTKAGNAVSLAYAWDTAHWQTSVPNELLHSLASLVELVKTNHTEALANEIQAHILYVVQQ